MNTENKLPKRIQLEFTPYQAEALQRLMERFGATAKGLVTNALNEYLARFDPVRVVLLPDERGSIPPSTT